MDRNLGAMQIVIIVVESLSARRAWIEIDAPSSAPYAELSLSARRAWIEMINGCNPDFDGKRRSPQGERG